MKKIILALLTVLVLVSAVACGNSSPWSKSDLARMIPVPLSSVRTVQIDETDEFSVDVGGISPKMFQDYISFCDAVGFQKNAKRSDSFYSAYHANGAFVTLTHSADQKTMRIDLISKHHRAFGLSLIEDIDTRLSELLTQIDATAAEIAALPVYKTSAVGGVLSTMETVEIRRVVYRLSRLLEDYSAEFSACRDNYAELDVTEFDEQVMDAYRQLGQLLETESKRLMHLTDSAYDLENAVDSLDRNVTAGTDLASLEQTLLQIDAELSRLSAAFGTSAFAVTVTETDENGVSLVADIDAEAFEEALCLTVPDLEDLGVLMEKCEELMLSLCESSIVDADTRRRYEVVEADVLAKRRAFYLTLETARDLEGIYDRYRKGEPLIMGEEDVMDILPSFPTLQTPLSGIIAQIESYETQIAEIQASVAAGEALSQPMVEKIRSELIKLQISLSDCTKEAIKLRRSGDCYPLTSPDSRPIFDGLEQQILTLRATLNGQITTLEKLSRAKDAQTLVGIERALEEIEKSKEACGERVEALIATVQEMWSGADFGVEEGVNEAATLLSEVSALQKRLRICLDDLIVVKSSSIDTAEIAHAMQLEETLYQMNVDLVSLRDNVQSLQRTLEMLQNSFR